MATMTMDNSSVATGRGALLHGVLASFPLAFYTAATFAFVTYAGTENVFWFHLAFVATVAGVVTDIIAAIPGIMDWQKRPNNSTEKQMATTHMGLHLTALVLFAVNAYLQYGKLDLDLPTAGSAITLSILGWVVMVAGLMYGMNLMRSRYTRDLSTPTAGPITETRKSVFRAS